MIVGIHLDWTNLPLLQRRHLDLNLEVTTLVEVERPLSHSPLVEIEVIDEIPLPHFNPMLPNTLDYVL